MASRLPVGYCTCTLYRCTAHLDLDLRMVCKFFNQCWNQMLLEVEFFFFGCFLLLPLFWPKIQCKEEVWTHDWFSLLVLPSWPSNCLIDAQEKCFGFWLNGADLCLNGFAKNQSDGRIWLLNVLGFSSIWITGGVFFRRGEKCFFSYSEISFPNRCTLYCIASPEMAQYGKPKTLLQSNCDSSGCKDPMMHSSQMTMQDRCDSWRLLMFPTTLNKVPSWKKVQVPLALCCLLKWLQQKLNKSLVESGLRPPPLFPSPAPPLAPAWSRASDAFWTCSNLQMPINMRFNLQLLYGGFCQKSPESACAHVQRTSKQVAGLSTVSCYALYVYVLAVWGAELVAGCVYSEARVKTTYIHKQKPSWLF